MAMMMMLVMMVMLVMMMMMMMAGEMISNMLMETKANDVCRNFIIKEL
jgi:hypothetical protein